MSRSLVVKVTCGMGDPERANQGFTVAASAIAMGVPVSLWLTGDAAWFALPDRADDMRLHGAAPLAELMEIVLSGGRITVCTQCAQRRGIGPDAVIPGIQIAGTALFTEEVLADDVQALVY